MKLGLTIFSESIGYPLILFFSVIFIKNYFFTKEIKKKKIFYFFNAFICIDGFKQKNIFDSFTYYCFGRNI